MSPAVTRTTPPGATPDVYRLEAPSPGHPAIWATLTLATPTEAFANVCIGPHVPVPDRRRFLAAVVDVVRSLGAAQLLVVVSTRDEPLVARLRPGCRVLASRAVGPTSMVRLTLAAAVDQGTARALEPVSPVGFLVERLAPGGAARGVTSRLLPGRPWSRASGLRVSADPRPPSTARSSARG